MTARAQADDRSDSPAPIIVDLSVPKNYEQMVVLGRMVAQWICAMPLEGIARMADDEARIALIKSVDADVLKVLRADRDVLDVLRSAQKQLQKIPGRLIT